MNKSFKKFKSIEFENQWIKINPAQTLTLGFLGLIFVGTLLLMLPFSTKDRHYLSFIDALFEATSAVCVTGLVVVDTHTTFTMFGQIVIMVLIQIGGLGFMTVGILIALFLGKNIGLKGRLMIQESLNQLSLEGMVRLVKFVVGFTLLLELIGAVVLSFRWISDFGFPKALFYGLFHSVSAFNNAGFDLMGGFSSMTGYVGDVTVILTLSSLLIIGGIGYTVILDLVNMTLSSQFVTMLLMFIGGGSGGTAGGIKVTTFVIIVLAVWTLIRGRDEVNVMGRRLPNDLVFRAFSITVYSTALVFFILFILTITEDAPLNVLLFEVISAFGTVGMSLGLTPELSPAGKVLISFMMFIGRVGPLTIAFALARATKKQPFKYVEEKIMIG